MGSIDRSRFLRLHLVRGPLLRWWPWQTGEARAPLDLEDLRRRGRGTKAPTNKGGGDNATHTIIHLTSVTEHRGPAKLGGRNTRKDRAPSSKELLAQQAKHSHADDDSRGRLSQTDLSSSSSSATLAG